MPTHGFDLIREERLLEINSVAYWMRHARSGAQLISIVNDDENKAFGVAFKTLPGDSTGVAHILEHSVLCGSRRYPVKEPFIELAKGSLKTFLNAMTYPDKTVYPVASTNTQDLYNLADVYMDAVFHPNITEWTLKQEGWHYELEDPASPIIYRGVVFNEMKGAYSSGDSVFARYLSRALAPDTVYGVDSGGDPAAIPDLSYDQFRQFWADNYHPSNARLWWYGNDDPLERLKFLDAWLNEFDLRPAAGQVGLQTPFRAPIRVARSYDAGAGDTARKAMAAVGWLMPEVNDEPTRVALEVLSHMLVGTPAAPLRKALVDSGLGEDLAPGTGFHSGLRQDSFATGLKGMRAADADKVETLVLDVLAQHAQHGFAQDLVAASLNSIEFRYREANFGSFPRGLVYFLSSLDTWLHDGDPFAPLRYEASFEALHRRIGAGEPVFETLIRGKLLDNPHRVTLVMTPDKQHKAAREAAERARLDAARAAMSEAEIARIVADTRTLKAMQVTPDAPEDLARIPTLLLADLEPKVSTIHSAELRAGSAAVLQHDLFTNGIAYLDVGLDLGQVPAADAPLLPLVGRMLLETGTDKEDFVSLSRRIGRVTGGIRGGPGIYVPHGGGDDSGMLARFSLSGKSTVAHFGDMLDIMRDVLLGARLDDRERLRQIATESKARLEAGLVGGGSAFAMTRLRAAYSRADAAREQLGGVSQLFFLRDLLARIDDDWTSLAQRIAGVREAMLDRNRMLCNVTLDAATWSTLSGSLGGFADHLPVRATPDRLDGLRAITALGAPVREALSIPSQVNFVGKAVRLYEHGYAMHGSAWVVINYLRTVYLWERVRVQGGAYGGQVSFDEDSGVLVFASYRDPNLVKTLEVYDDAGSFLRLGELSADEVRRCIIGVIGDLDAYQLPDAKGGTALRRWLTGYTDEERQRRRDEVLGTTADDFHRFGEALSALGAHGRVAIVGSPQAIEKAHAEKGDGWMSVTPVL